MSAAKTTTRRATLPASDHQPAPYDRPTREPTLHHQSRPFPTAGLMHTRTL
jgi:hypothetical protein